MGWEILSLLASIAMIVGGASGRFVLRGTNSSTGLVVFGVVWLIYDIYQLATHNARAEKAAQAAEAARLAREEAQAAEAQAAQLPEE